LGSPESNVSSPDHPCQPSSAGTCPNITHRLTTITIRGPPGSFTPVLDVRTPRGRLLQTAGR
jgi:hypothetical protein